MPARCLCPRRPASTPASTEPIRRPGATLPAGRGIPFGGSGGPGFAPGRSSAKPCQARTIPINHATSPDYLRHLQASRTIGADVAWTASVLALALTGCQSSGSTGGGAGGQVSGSGGSGTGGVTPGSGGAGAGGAAGGRPGRRRNRRGRSHRGRRRRSPRRAPAHGRVPGRRHRRSTQVRRSSGRPRPWAGTPGTPSSAPSARP